jgi:hypothetical protein
MNENLIKIDIRQYFVKQKEGMIMYSMLEMLNSFVHIFFGIHIKYTYVSRQMCLVKNIICVIFSVSSVIVKLQYII